MVLIDSRSKIEGLSPLFICLKKQKPLGTDGLKQLKEKKKKRQKNQKKKEVIKTNAEEKTNTIPDGYYESDEYKKFCVERTKNIINLKR